MSFSSPAAVAAATGRKASAVKLTCAHRLGVEHLAKATASCWRYCQSRCPRTHGTTLLKKEAVDGVDTQLIEEVSSAKRPAVIAQQRLALAVEWFEHITSVLAGAEAKALS
jgi:hypothetical protein